jgi:hypothetical protein
MLKVRAPPSCPKTVAASDKENLLGYHVVAVENGGKDAVLFVETLIFFS